MWKRLKILTLLIVMSVAAGCDRGEKLGRVFGTVTYQGQPVTAGILVFSNHQAGVHMTAELNSDGTYELQTAGGFGLPLGTYQVAVNPPMAEPPVLGSPNPAPRVPPSNNIPPKYRDFETSGLTITVGEGENPFDIEMQPGRGARSSS